MEDKRSQARISDFMSIRFLNPVEKSEMYHVNLRKKRFHNRSQKKRGLYKGTYGIVEQNNAMEREWLGKKIRESLEDKTLKITEEILRDKDYSAIGILLDKIKIRENDQLLENLYLLKNIIKN